MWRRFWYRLTERVSTPSWLAAALLLLPVVLALSLEARDGHWRSPPHADEAVLQIHLRQALHGRHLLGPYSQYDWYHPGPLYYYLLAPLYVLSGGATHSLFFSAGLIHAVALGLTLAVYFRFDRSPITRFAFIAVLSFTLAAFLERPPLGAFDASPITEIWNPLVPVLPFVLAMVVAAAVAVGHLEFAPVLALLQAFTAQTHVSYAPATTLLLFCGLAAGFRASRARTRNFRLRWLALSVGTIFVLWLPPLIAAVAGHYGNARSILDFVLSSARPRVPRGAAFAYAVRQLHWMALHPLGLSPDAAATLGGILTAGQLLGAGFAWRAAEQRGQSYLGWLAVVPAAASLVALAQAPSLASLDETLHYYQTLWYCIVGCFAWFGVTLLASFATEQRKRGFAGLVVGLGYLAALGYSAFAVGRVHDDFTRCRARARSADVLPALLVRSVGTLMERAGRAAFNPISPNSWVTLASLVLDFSKRGVDLPINARWRFMFGTGARYAPENSPAVEISGDGVHAEPLWRAFGELKLYTSGFEPTFPPSPLSAAGEHVRGDPQRVLSEPTPSDGEPWDGAGAVVLSDGSSSLTITLPLVSVSRLEIVADGNDDYAIDGSRDGSAFEPLGTLPSVGQRGLARRDVQLAQRGPWRSLRIRPGRGDGSYSVAHLRLLDAGFDCKVIGATEARDPAERLCDGETAPVGSPWDGPKSVRLSGSSAIVTVALPPVALGAHVRGIAIESDGNDLYSVEASRNGTDFVRIGTTEGHLKFGMRWFPFFFNDFFAWTAVRLRPAFGDGSRSLAEIRPLVTRGLLLDVANESVRAFLRDGWSMPETRGGERFVPTSGRGAYLSVPLETDTTYELVFAMRANAGIQPTTFAVELNHHRLLEARLPPGATQTISVELPAYFVAEENELGFVIVPGQDQDWARLPPARLEFLGALFEPSVL